MPGDHHRSITSGTMSESMPCRRHQVKYALFRHKQIHVSRPHMGDMASEKCINSKA